MSAADSERVDSGDLQDNALAVVPASCPLCGGPAVWAFSGRESPDRVLLAPDSAQRVSVPRGRTVVVATSGGRLLAVTPWMFRLHVCDPNSITNAIGEYTADVLSVSCPVDSCAAPPGEVCVSSRYDVLPRPHGSRVAFAAGSPWSDEDSIISSMVDEPEV